MTRRPGVGTSTTRRVSRMALTMSGMVLVAALAACSSTNSTTPTTSASTTASNRSAIPASAFSDHTGITTTSVAVGNVSTLFIGLFKGAVVGTQAYADYVNSQGGVNGRRINVDGSDDNYQGAPNKQETQAAIQKDFAMVGGFSLQDNFGGAVLAANPQVPNVTVSLNLATSNLPNSFSPAPAVNGWQLGPLAYFQKKYPSQIRHAAALVADQPSATSKWAAEKQAMTTLGYNVVYDPTFDITTTDFNQYVVAMKSAGVKILFLEQMPENYAAAVVKALNQQDYHPELVFGASTYSERLVPDSGGAAAIDGTYMEMVNSLFLGEDAGSLPAADTFQKWVQKVSPGFKPDLYTLFGWLSGQLFAQALQAAGPKPTRGSLLQQLKKITVFNGNYLIASSNPSAKTPAHCYVIAQIKNGQIQRLDDPPIDGPQHGYRCDGSFYYYPPK